MKRQRSLESNNVQRFSYVFLGAMCVVFLFPMYAALMVSISSRESILRYGYQLFPSQFSLEAYRLLFTEYGVSLLRAIVLTVGTGIVQPLFTVFLCMLMAYPLSQDDFRGRKFWRVFLVVTMLFSGGIVPSYILKTRFLHLQDTVMIFLIPTVSAWSIFLFRVFYINIEKAIVESARIDGANRLQIVLRIMLPLTKPLVAMEFFSGFLARWNDINIPLYYIRNRNLYTVQFMLQEMIRSAERAKALLEAGLSTSFNAQEIPIESTRFALAVIGAVPALILFPFLQKYYAKGISIGSTKG